MLRSLLKNLKVVSHADEHVRLHSDHMSAIDYSNDFKFLRKNKYHLIRNKKDEVQQNYIPRGQVVAYSLIKPFALNLFKAHVKAKGLRRC